MEQAVTTCSMVLTQSGIPFSSPLFLESGLTASSTKCTTTCAEYTKNSNRTSEERKSMQTFTRKERCIGKRPGRTGGRRQTAGGGTKNHTVASSCTKPPVAPSRSVPAVPTLPVLCLYPSGDQRAGACRRLMKPRDTISSLTARDHGKNRSPESNQGHRAVHEMGVAVTALPAEGIPPDTSTKPGKLTTRTTTALQDLLQSCRVDETLVMPHALARCPISHAVFARDVLVEM